MITVYPGIFAEYHDFTCDQKHFHHNAKPNMLEINHCHYGRVGWTLNNGQSIYMGEGDTTLHSSVLCATSNMHFPLGSYQGITITIDFDEIMSNPPEFLEGLPIDYEKLLHVYCRKDKSFTMNTESDIDHIFHSLYHLPEYLKETYLKLRTIELIIYLSRNLAPTSPTPRYHSDIIAAIEKIHTQMTGHLDVRYTIQALSEQYLINTSTLKDAFKAVYGMAIAAYMKEYRMRHAAKLLRHTDDSIKEIGRQVGYESASKFTNAFKEVFGTLPKDYRNSTSV